MARLASGTATQADHQRFHELRQQDQGAGGGGSAAARSTSASAGQMGPPTPDAISAQADSSEEPRAHHSGHPKTPHPKAPGVGGDIHVGTMNVHIDPQMTDAQIGRKWREQLKKAQAQANVQSTLGG